jgi:hypothetical protein
MTFGFGATDQRLVHGRRLHACPLELLAVLRVTDAAEIDEHALRAGEQLAASRHETIAELPLANLSGGVVDAARQCTTGRIRGACKTTPRLVIARSDDTRSGRSHARECTAQIRLELVGHELGQTTGLLRPLAKARPMLVDQLIEEGLLGPTALVAV